MSQGQATVARKNRFAAIDMDIVEDLSLSCWARLTLAWVMSKPDGWVFHISHLQRSLGLTSSVWNRVRNELITMGFFTQTKSRSPEGKVRWENKFTDTPIPLQKNQRVEDDKDKQDAKAATRSILLPVIHPIKIPANLAHIKDEIIKNTVGLPTVAVDQLLIQLSAGVQSGNIENAVAWLTSCSRKAKNGDFVHVLTAKKAVPSGIKYEEQQKKDDDERAAEKHRAEAASTKKTEIVNHFNQMPAGKKSEVETKFKDSLDSQTAALHARKGLASPIVVSSFYLFSQKNPDLFTWGAA